MPTAPTPVTNITTPVPVTSDPTTFDIRADLAWTELPVAIEGINDIGDNVYANAVEAAESAAAAASSANTASAVQTAVLGVLTYAATSNSSVEVSVGTKTVHTEETGRTFAVGDDVLLIRRSDRSVRLEGVIATSDGSDDFTVTVTSGGVSTAGAGNTYDDWIMVAAWYFPAGATAAEVSALVSALVSVTPKALGDALAFVDGGTGSGTWTPDLASGPNQKRTINGNSTLAAMSNPKEGECFYFEITWSATATLSLNSGYKFFGGAPSPPTASGSICAVSGVVKTAAPFAASCTFLSNRQA